LETIHIEAGWPWRRKGKEGKRGLRRNTVHTVFFVQKRKRAGPINVVPSSFSSKRKKEGKKGGVVAVFFASVIIIQRGRGKKRRVARTGERKKRGGMRLCGAAQRISEGKEPILLSGVNACGKGGEKEKETQKKKTEKRRISHCEGGEKPQNCP